MSRFPRLLTILAVLGLALLLAACGTDDDGDTADDAGDDTTDGATDDGATDDGATDDGATDDGATSDIDPETYYEGKTIRFVTSSGAGGGTDARIRSLASVITNFLPGNPSAQVSNVTPHVAGINFVWGSEPDGLTVGMTAAPTLEFEFFEGAEWNTNDFEIVGTMDSTCDAMLLVRGDLGYETVEDMSGGDETLVTMTAAPSPADVEPIALGTMLLADMLDWPLEVRRVAESGSAALNLALERGEINTARHGNDWCRLTTDRPEWYEEEFVIPMLDMGTGGPQAIPESIQELGYDPPHLSDVLDPDQFARYQGLVNASRAGGNPVFLPPGTPEEIVELWREAWVEAYQDPDYVEIMARTFGGEPFDILTGEEAEALFEENRELMEQFQPEFNETAERLYDQYVN